jgi:hypothetical protein
VKELDSGSSGAWKNRRRLETATARFSDRGRANSTANELIILDQHGSPIETSAYALPSLVRFFYEVCNVARS